MGRTSDPRFDLLHRLRVTGLSSLADADSGVLGELAAEGLVEWRDGVVTGWRLTAAGRQVHAGLVVVDRAGVEAAVEDGYLAILVLNPLVLALCVDAQQEAIDGGPAAVADRLGALHARAIPVLAQLSSALERFGRYRARLDAAVERVRAGELDFVARPLVDSYHSAWSELHEDLLATLGIARGSEPMVGADGTNEDATLASEVATQEVR